MCNPIGNPRVIKLPEWRAENKKIFLSSYFGLEFFRNRKF